MEFLDNCRQLALQGREVCNLNQRKAELLRQLWMSCPRLSNVAYVQLEIDYPKGAILWCDQLVFVLKTKLENTNHQSVLTILLQIPLKIWVSFPLEQTRERSYAEQFFESSQDIGQGFLWIWIWDHSLYLVNELEYPDIRTIEENREESTAQTPQTRQLRQWGKANLFANRGTPEKVSKIMTMMSLRKEGRFCLFKKTEFLS